MRNVVLVSRISKPETRTAFLWFLVSSFWFPHLVGLRRPTHSLSLAGGMNVMARSARAVIVSEGFTPGLADIAAPSIT
jgi:hypothetical protein